VRVRASVAQLPIDSTDEGADPVAFDPARHPTITGALVALDPALLAQRGGCGEEHAGLEGAVRDGGVNVVTDDGLNAREGFGVGRGAAYEFCEPFRSGGRDGFVAGCGVERVAEVLGGPGQSGP
jgi:hypothetical protein